MKLEGSLEMKVHNIMSLFLHNIHLIVIHNDFKTIVIEPQDTPGKTTAANSYMYSKTVFH